MVKYYQFHNLLYADVKGNRPGFSNSKNPDQAVKYMSILMMRYERMVLL